ncbi:MAG: Xaa-Pro peptidase family protein [Bacillota bacterium]
MKYKISAQELQQRQNRLLRRAEEGGMDGFLTFSTLSIFYLTGFHFIATERPACLVIPVEGPSFLFVPHLEVEHAQTADVLDDVVTYPEYPGETHPMEVLAGEMRERGLGEAHLLAESPAYGSPMGYAGPRLTELLPDLELTVEPKVVEKMRVVKSPAEIELIRESARWGNLAHTLLQEYCAHGRTENEVSLQASGEATMVMMKTLGPEFEPLGGRAGAGAGFRGQIGVNSALPHAVNINAVMRRGDNLVTGAGAGVGGYGSELERTMFLGEPSADQRKYFEYMMEMMQVAFDTIRPGIPCSEVDRAVQEVYRKYDIIDTWRHHTGHCLGLLGHEAPFFDIGDDTMIEEGMVFSVEPGVYVPGLGGFRHSDTIVVTADGMDFITYYPREIEDLIIDA